MAEPSNDFFELKLDEEDAYFSIDVETDGAIPGDFSMLSFAIVAAGHHDGNRYFGPFEKEEEYWELKPISSNFEHGALDVNRLDREDLARSGLDPTVAMAQAKAWVEARSHGRRPVMVASPLGFDWMFLHWYFVKFVGASPFGHSSAFDLKTAIAMSFGRSVAMSGRRNFPNWMESKLPHSHNALDDARKQAEEFQTIREWLGPRDSGE